MNVLQFEIKQCPPSKDKLLTAAKLVHEYSLELAQYDFESSGKLNPVFKSLLEHGERLEKLATEIDQKAS